MITVAKHLPPGVGTGHDANVADRWQVMGVSLMLLTVVACSDDAAEPSTRPTLDLRQVTDVLPGPCPHPPLRGDGPGKACDLPGKYSYELGRSLGRVTVTHATSRVIPGAGPSVVATLDRAGRKLFAQVTDDIASQPGRTALAILLNGELAFAPTVTERITTGKIKFFLPNDSDRGFVARGLSAEHRPAPQNPGPDIPSLSSAQQREVRQACRNAQPRLAPGMDGRFLVVSEPLTAPEAADLARDAFGAQTPKYWDRQPPDTVVYVCNYQGKLTGTPNISCPAGEQPAVPGRVRALSFLVSERGKGTFLDLPPGPANTDLCAS